jgi:signal transduction histidine kinase
METGDKRPDMRSEQLNFLNQIGREFSASLDLRIVIGRVMSRVKEVLGCEASSVILYDEIKDSLVFYAASGAGAREVTGLAIPKGRGIAGWVFVHGNPLIVNDASRDNRFYTGIDRITGFETKSLICVPVEKQGRILGVIEGINKNKDDFDQEDLEMLTAIAQLASISIENSKIHENLERKNKELLQLNREMEEFVHIVSHDLQSPLVSIQGYTNLIKGEMAVLLKSNDALNTYVERIQENCKNTLHFVRRLLDYSRLQNSSIVIDVFNPISVLGEVLEQLRSEIAGSNAHFIHPNDLPTIRYDRYLFHHILLNLVQNSLKYAARSPESDIHEQDEGPIIEMGCEEHEYEYHFFISDNGPGLLESDKERIFNIYEQGNGSGLSSGYGIGLAFVKKAVQLMNGTVWVESRRGKGTTFYFSIRR